MEEKHGYVYIMANKRPTLYAGVTSNLFKRVFEHKNNLVKGFTSKYNLHSLVYFEIRSSKKEAIIREKQIKDMNRAEKIDLIKNANPHFKDLYSTLV